MSRELLIGREPNENNLVMLDQKQILRLVSDKTVPNTVSRLKPEVPTAHCSIVIDDISVKIKNLNPENSTFVDDKKIDKICTLKPTSTVHLGPDKYPLDLAKILQKYNFHPAFSTRHLESVWREYDQKLLKLQLDQQKQQNQQRLQTIFSQVGMLAVVIPMCIPSLEIPTWIRAAASIAAVALAIYFYIRGSRVNNSFVIKKRNLDKEFKELYRCPNPACRSFFGFVDYETSILPRNKCPNCGCKYTH